LCAKLGQPRAWSNRRSGGAAPWTRMTCNWIQAT
jgi:hypothetical protein